MLGISLGLLSGLMYGAADFVGGLASRRSSTFAVVVNSQGVGLIALLALTPVLPRATPTAVDIGWGLLAGIGGAGGIAFLYRGLAIGRMSLVSPVTAVVAAIIPIGVGLIKHERPTSEALIGITLALVAVVLISASEHPGDPASNVAPGLVGQSEQSPRTYRSQTRVLPPGLLEAVLSGLGIGLFYVFIAHTNPNSGLWPLAGSRTASMLVVSVLALIANQPLRPERGAFASVAFAGAMDMTANALFLLATRHGLLAIVAVLASLYPASTVLLARILLHERLTRVQLAGVVCALCAVALIAAGSASPA